MKEIYEFLKTANTYFLATIDNNKPRVRPFGTIDLFDGKLTIQTGLKKDVARQMIENPWIEICAMAEGRWIRISAKVKLDERLEAAQHMLDNYPELKSMYAPGDGNTAVFALMEGTATISSFTEAPKTITF